MRLQWKHIEAITFKEIKKLRPSGKYPNFKGAKYPQFKETVAGLQAACLMFSVENVVRKLNRMVAIDAMNEARRSTRQHQQ